MRSVSGKFQFLTALLVFTTGFPIAPLFAVSPVASGIEGRTINATVDVSLTSQGLLSGQVLNGAGRPMADAKVLLHDGHGTPVVARTNERGAFAYRDLPSGVYYLQSGDHLCVARVWSAEAAPPKSQRSVLLIGQTDILRAQMNAPPRVNGAVQPSKRILTNPLAVAGIVATAVAIPVAIHNSDSSS